MINSKKKGSRAELEVADIFKSHGYTARRTQQYCGYTGEASDVIVDVAKDYLHVEVKHDERLNVHAAVAQAVRDCPVGKYRTVFHRKNRTGWLVTMPVEDWIEVFAELVTFRRK